MKFSNSIILSSMALVNYAAAQSDCQDIVDVACSLDDFSTLCEAVQLAGLGDALSEGAWTVFAPTNTAFEELGQELLDTVLADKALLSDILLFHAVDEVVKAEDLFCTGLTEMANGQDSRTVCRDGKIFQKGGSNPRNDMPEIVQTDIETCQGVIHVVDEVLLPGRLVMGPPKPECQSIAEIACGLDNFSTLCEAVELAGLDGALSGGTWTVFAPTNKAFEELGQATLDAVLGDIDLLTNILLFHAADHVLFEEDLECTHVTRMANGKDSRHVCTRDGVFQKGKGNPRSDMPKIVDTDIGACNGVIHVVDEVMLPP